MTCRELCFTMKEMPHRIEISEGDTFDAMQSSPYSAGIIYEIYLPDPESPNLNEAEISEFDLGRVDTGTH